MRTAEVVSVGGALVNVLARVAIGGQLSADHGQAAALVRTIRISACTLARSVAVAQRALVVVFLKEKKTVALLSLISCASKR